MRKFILVIAMFLITSFMVGAQTEQGGGGDIAVELTMTPFTGSEAWLTPGYIKGRYFFGDFGARLSVGTGMLFSTDQEHQPETVKNLSFFDIRPGVEYYLSRSGQALPFVGLDLIFANQKTSYDASVGAPVTGAWDIENLQNRGFFAFGFNLVAGGDYYLGGGGFFIGTELGFEFLYFNNHEVKWGEEIRIPKTKTAQFKPTLSSVLRIGVAF